MRRIIIFTWVMLMAIGAMAQNGKLLSSTLERVEKDGASVITGSATVSGPAGNDVMDFSLSLAGNRFLLNIDDGETIIWYDSKTLWRGADYGDGIEEIYISTPIGGETAMLNPAELLRQHAGFKLAESGQDSFSLTSTSADGTTHGISKINVKADPATMRPKAIDMTMGQGQSATVASVRISEWKPGQKFSDTMFTCPVKDYPDAEIIDLR